MRAAQFVALNLFCSLMLGIVPAAQSQQTAANMEAQAWTIVQILTDPDLPKDAGSTKDLTATWIELTCRSKALNYQKFGVDDATASTIVKNCTKRISLDPAAALAEAKKNMPPAGPKQNAVPVTAGGIQSVPAPPCSLDAAPVDTTSTPGSSKYMYTIHCASGTTPAHLGLQAASALTSLSAAQAIGFANGITFDKADATNGAAYFTIPSGSTSPTFQFVIPTASSKTVDATYYITSDAKANDAFTACKTATSAPTCSTGIVQVPVPAPPAVATCPMQPTYDFKDVSLTLSGIEADAPATGAQVNGKVKGFSDGDKVLICAKATGKPLGDPVEIQADGSFPLTLSKDTKLSDGDNIVAQYIKHGVNKAADQYGSAPSTATVLVGDCRTANPGGPGSGPKLYLSEPDTKSMVTYTGDANLGDANTGDKKFKARICVNYVPNAEAGTPDVSSDGTFKGSNPFKGQAGDMVVAISPL